MDRKGRRSANAMANHDDGGPAFPMPFLASAAGDNTTLTVPFPGEVPAGMSLRDYFAAHAPPMPEYLRLEAEVQSRAAAHAQPDDIDAWQGIYAYLLAKWATRYADAMLKARMFPTKPHIPSVHGD